MEDTHTQTHKAEPADEHEDVTALWNQELSTDREVTKNRPDLIIKKQAEKPCILIDVATPADKCHAKGSKK
jgi:hypothetical protein